MNKDLISIYDLTPGDIEDIFRTSKELKGLHQQGKGHRSLEGKTLAMIFEKPSTRTRVSFEAGMYHLGGHALFLNPQDTQLGRGETIGDMSQVLSRYVDGIMIRTYAHDRVQKMASCATIPVINGLSDLLHPCQILSDVFTIWEKIGKYDNIKVAYIGDGNNVANSWINGALCLGFDLWLACPPGYEPDNAVLSRAMKESASKIVLTKDPKEAADKAHVINTDVWASMGQEAEHKDRTQVFHNYQVNTDLVQLARDDVLVMHCLPAHRGEEITDEVLDGPNAIIFDQAENRLHVQKAILALLLGERQKSGEID